MSKFDDFMFNVEYYAGRYSKAVWGAASAGILATVAAFGTALADGDLTGRETAIAIGAGLVVLGGVGSAVAKSPKNAE